MHTSKNNQQITGRTLLFLPGNGFSFQEYSTIKQTLEEDGIAMRTVSGHPDTIVSAEGNNVTPDLTVGQAKDFNWDAIIFAGGSGEAEYAASAAAVALAREQWARGGLVAAIGPAMRALAAAGILAGNRVVAGESQRRHLRTMGAIIADGIALQDGNVITGRDPADVHSFAHLVSGAIQALNQ